MKAGKFFTCVMTVIVIMAPSCLVWGAANGGNTITSQISSPGPHQVNSWVTGKNWFDYPEAATCEVSVDSWLLRNGGFIAESQRGTFEERSRPIGVSKYVEVNGSELGVYWCGNGDFNETFQTFTVSSNQWKMTIGGSWYFGGTKSSFSSIITIH